MRRPNLTFWGHPNLTFKERPWKVDSGLPLENLQSTQTWMSQTFLSELIRLIRSIQKHFNTQGLLKNESKFLHRAFSAKLVHDFIAVNYFRERPSSYKIDWVLNTPLILSSNAIWHDYRLITETTIFRLSVSLIYLLYVKEDWIDKKSYYRNITSNTENFQVHLQ